MGADPRFYESLGPVCASALAEQVGAQLVGDGTAQALNVSSLAKARVGDVCFLASEAGELGLAGAIVLVNDTVAGEAALAADAAAVLVHSAPKAAYALACGRLIAPRIHAGDAAHNHDARIAPDARLSPGVVVGQGADIAPGAQVGPNTVIGPGVRIGAGTRIGAGAVIHFADIGAGCEIAAGAVIGESGFGLAQLDKEIVSLPHVGRVIIEDAVTLGANVTVDRGMFDDTWLKTGCRIDNLCHIGHNVVVGEMAVMAAFAGISGSVTVGAGAQFGGRVGVADHLTIGDGARLAADAAVMRSIPAGETWAGSPAQPIKSFMRETAWVRRQVGQRGSNKTKT
ncbi:MAG: UDP-3-O-(3-hydroxymyristoyl)glucosamine N-acyltransferase [Pseudomonadota bacterium]